MTQKEFYDKHKEAMNAFFSGEKVMVRWSGPGSDRIAQSDDFINISDWDKPEDVEFDIIKPKEPDLLGKKIRHKDGSREIVDHCDENGEYTIWNTKGGMTAQEIIDDPDIEILED